MDNREAYDRIDAIIAKNEIDDEYVTITNLKDYEALRIARKILEQQPCEDVGEISDGYHTFNQLYHQRAILFATIVNQNKDIAWKSYKHSDGKYCFDSNGEWFIVGIDTPEGSYTYHYSKEYWDYFKCKELDCGKEWDGHTEEDVTRLLSLEQEPCDDAISRQAVLDLIEHYNLDGLGSVFYCYEEGVKFADAVNKLPSVSMEKTGHWISDAIQGEIDGQIVKAFICSECGAISIFRMTGGKIVNGDLCPNCGAKMEVEE